MADDLYGGLGNAGDSQWVQGRRLAQAEVQRYQKAIAAATADGRDDVVAELTQALNAKGGPREAFRQAYQREYESADALRGMTRPAVEGNAVQKLGAGLIGSLATTGMKLRNLLPQGVPGAVSNRDLAEIERRNQPLAADPTSGAGWFGGELGGWAGAGEGEAAALAKLATKLKGAGLGEGLASPVARSIVRQTRQGAEMGAVEAPPDQRGTGAIVGGLGGMAGGTGIEALRAGAGLLTRGVTPTADAAALRSQLPDGTLTWGMTNPDSLIGRWEQNPISRSIVKPARDEAAERLNLLAANRSSVPFADPGPMSDKEMAQLAARIEGGERGSLVSPPRNPNAPVKNQLFDASADTFDPYYSALNSYPAAPHVMNTGANTPLQDAFLNIGGFSTKTVNGKKVRVPNELAATLQGYLKNTIAQAKKDGGMTTGHLRALREQIDKTTPAIGPDTTPEVRAQIAKLAKAREVVTDAIQSQLPPGAQKLWKATDSVYGANSVLGRATNAGKGAGETLSGYDLEQAAANDTRNQMSSRSAARGRDSTRQRDAAGNEIEGTGLRDLGRQMRRVTKEQPHTGEQSVQDKAIEFLTGLPGGIAGLPFAALSRYAPGRRLIQGSTGFQGALRAAQQAARDKLPNLSGPLSRLGMDSAARLPTAYMLDAGVISPVGSFAAGPLATYEAQE